MRIALALLTLFAAACHNDTPTEDENLILVGGAADEIFTSFLDLETQQLIMTDDTQAAFLTAPTDGEMVPSGTPFMFTFDVPMAGDKVPRHGESTGTFYWLQLTGPGLAETGLNVIVYGGANDTVRSWTPGGLDWVKVKAATGAVSVMVTRGRFDDTRPAPGGGPFRPSGAPPSFTLTQ